ncbi:DUF3168 domain-containing protein [Nitrobacter sp.]|uniref:DUF3168 domain-containing protein n=1 Tax=Nitrobacter sp. TaxID=29420 RepID=UPI003F64B630
MDTIGPDGILDTIGRPERERCILIGQSQAVYRGEIATVYSTLHVWIKEPGLRLAKEVVGAVVDAVSLMPRSRGSISMPTTSRLPISA